MGLIRDKLHLDQRWVADALQIFSRGFPKFFGYINFSVNSLSANPTKWSNTFKKADELFGVFDHFVGLALEGLMNLKLTLPLERHFTIES